MPYDMRMSLQILHYERQKIKISNSLENTLVEICFINCSPLVECSNFENHRNFISCRRFDSSLSLSRFSLNSKLPFLPTYNSKRSRSLYTVSIVPLQYLFDNYNDVKNFWKIFQFAW